MEFNKFMEKQWKLIVGVLGVIVVAGAIATLLTVRVSQKEHSAQERYFAAEKKMNDLKNKKSDPLAADKKEKAKPEVIDYSGVKKDLEKIIVDFPGSIASQMAALHISNILVDEKNTDSALATLQKVTNTDRGLVNTLVQQQIGQLLADKDKCSEAIAIWQKIIERKEASFIHNETKIQQALCYTKLKDFKRAEEILTNLANQSVNVDMSNTASTKEAEKYLRLIQFKKASGT